eukprot:CAMPEP_0202810160 /NCGR_PEP_ID=MMETSP1389-20130828/2341_1 /ASSEMBLY_ACC=CAM_ASM_000865 /TAXON_ID=302021 /ORGANISM="Rhodomonas sp., Strain CCMP768" /LENGTH=78 /DNA_ID=CAMNT_0049480983 /DNA_START=169 /DNA_END=405 /DNA_ORIENTATION=-
MFDTIRRTQELLAAGSVYPYGLTKDTSITDEASWISKPDGNEQPAGCKDGFTYRYAHPAGHPVHVSICSTIGAWSEPH